MDTLEPPKILIVEDSIASAMLMEATINRKKPDFLVRTRRSWKGAMEEFAAFRPHLVILDLTLPDSPSEETLLKIHLLCEKACVIIFSGSPEYREEAMRAGANDFFGKGIGADPQPFIDRITNLMPQCYPHSS
jgi:PleD family two-component response regulator